VAKASPSLLIWLHRTAEKDSAAHNLVWILNIRRSEYDRASAEAMVKLFKTFLSKKNYQRASFGVDIAVSG